MGKLRPRGILAAEGGRVSWEKELFPGLQKHGFGPGACLDTGRERERISTLLLAWQVTVGKACQCSRLPSVSPSVKWG